jgi:hypothetical protein
VLRQPQESRSALRVDQDVGCVNRSPYGRGSVWWRSIVHGALERGENGCRASCATVQLTYNLVCRGNNMPAPDVVGVGHGTRRRSARAEARGSLGMSARAEARGSLGKSARAEARGSLDMSARAEARGSDG